MKDDKIKEIQERFIMVVENRFESEDIILRNVRNMPYRHVDHLIQADWFVNLPNSIIPNIYFE